MLHVGNPTRSMFYVPQLLQLCWSVSCSGETLITSPAGSSVKLNVSRIYHNGAELWKNCLGCCNKAAICLTPHIEYLSSCVPLIANADVQRSSKHFD